MISKMILKEFFNWLFPSKCLICSCEVVENSIFCPECFSKITIIDYPFCKTCGKMFETSFDDDMVCNTCLKYQRSFEKARSLFLYNEISKQIIMKVKRQSDDSVARVCAKMLFSKYRDLFTNADFIIPVPSHWSRLLSRGFNPSDIIAGELSKVSGVPVRRVLKRVRKTQYQRNKGISERFENVRDAFDCKLPLQGKIVILVDDVMTTGATLNECAATLKRYGCVKVFCLTIGTTRNV